MYIVLFNEQNLIVIIISFNTIGLSIRLLPKFLFFFLRKSIIVKLLVTISFFCCFFFLFLFSPFLHHIVWFFISKHFKFLIKFYKKTTFFKNISLVYRTNWLNFENTPAKDRKKRVKLWFSIYAYFLKIKNRS